MRRLQTVGCARPACGMRILIAFALLLFAVPALAAGTEIAEPSNLALFGLGVMGVLLGRRSARIRRED